MPHQGRQPPGRDLLKGHRPCTVEVPRLTCTRHADVLRDAAGTSGAALVVVASPGSDADCGRRLARDCCGWWLGC
jgi:hypothetical protein